MGVPRRPIAWLTLTWWFHMFIASMVVALAVALNQYTVRITPVVAVQGGPVVVDVEVVYTGSDSVEVNVHNIGPIRGFYVEAPKGWNVERVPERNYFHFGITSYFVAVKRGEMVTRQRIHLEKEFAGPIPPGDVAVTVRWAGGVDARSDRHIQAFGTQTLRVLSCVP